MHFCLMPAMLSGGGGGNPGGNFAVRSIVTETGTTPSATKITLGAAQNAVRVFTELVAASEPFFHLYVKRNSDSVQKVKVYPWTARIFTGAAGDTFAFSTSDGRTLAMAAMTVPGTLEDSFPETGTANADTGCPPYWSPSAAHVTLADSGSAFQLADTSTSELVFIREFDGSQWTPVRWVRKQSGRATSVRCTYTQIALATLDGATLSIAAPTGAVIGGASTDMVNPFLPVVTGATHNVTDVATLKTAIAAAAAGDEIVLAAGTYALDVQITETSFTVNHNGSTRNGMGGILIRGATGDPADVVLTGDGDGNNGRWVMSGDATLTGGLEGLSWDVDGIGANLHMLGGKWALQDLIIDGAPTGGLDNLGYNATTALTIDALRVTCTNGGADLFNGDGDAEFNDASRCRFVQCIGETAGATSQDQCLTSHTGLTTEWYGGRLEDADANIAAPDAASTAIHLFFADVNKGARKSGLSNCYTYACDIDGDNGTSFGSQNGAWFNRLVFTGLGSTQNVVRSSVHAFHSNYAESASGSGRGIFDSNNTGAQTGARYNVFHDFGEGYRCNNSTGAGGSSASYGNTFNSCAIAMELSDNNMLIAISNNASKGSSNGVVCTTTSMPHITTDFNTLDPTIDGDFVAGANDLVAGDAALDTFYFPTAAGNCDGNGDTALEDFIGDSDPWGYVRVYKADRVSRGARDIPAIHASAYLQPDLF